MRKNIVAGNWKMHKTFGEAKELMTELHEYMENHKVNCEVAIAPAAVYLHEAKEIFPKGEVGVFAQEVSEHESGAYTGEISVNMLASLELNGSIIGHSERRRYYAETDEKIHRKIKAVLSKGLTPIYCNGESLEQRRAGEHFDIIKAQTQTALFALTADEIKKVIIAYEPVWAIGTGETATPEQAQEMHAHIRGLIAAKYGKAVADEISILYGGSVKPANAKEIFSKSDVDGGLIGGAALNIKDFSAIIEAFN